MKNKAQATIEFTLAFVCSLLFLILTVNLFCWFNHCLVDRQRTYEATRTDATRIASPGVWDYEPPELNVFVAGGHE